MTAKAVYFDLDDTLIKEIHSVMLPCILNGKEKEHSVVQERGGTGEFDYITADHLRAGFLLGLDEAVMAEWLLEAVKLLKDISETINILHSYDTKCLLITVGPLQVVKVMVSVYEFDKYYGSDYEVVCGKFTGKIVKYIKAGNKIDCLKDSCQTNNIAACDYIAVGGGSTDIPVFRYCEKSTALNAPDKVKNKSTHPVDADNLLDTLSYILQALDIVRL